MHLSVFPLCRVECALCFLIPTVLPLYSGSEFIALRVCCQIFVGRGIFVLLFLAQRFHQGFFVAVGFAIRLLNNLRPLLPRLRVGDCCQAGGDVASEAFSSLISLRNLPIPPLNLLTAIARMVSLCPFSS